MEGLRCFFRRMAAVLFAMIAAPSLALAGGLEVFPDIPTDMNNVIFENAPFSGVDTGIQIRITMGCFGPNLRPVSNPLHPAARVKLLLQLIRPAEGSVPANPVIGIEFPGKILFPEVWGPTESAATIMTGLKYTGIAPSVLQSWKLGYTQVGDNRYEILARTNLTRRTGTVGTDGSVNIMNLPTVVGSFFFVQSGLAATTDAPAGWENVVGANGVLSAYETAMYQCRRAADWTAYESTACAPGDYPYPASGYTQPNVSPDGKTILLSAYFPGAATSGQQAAGIATKGYCGSYYSPLMVFFDEKRPLFIGKSRFPLEGLARLVHWPEAGAPGYFLAMDRNGNGSIDDGGELFGDTESVNGFEALKPLDTNGDGVVSADDKEFGKLLLWKDADGNGKSKISELMPLSRKRIVSIALKYDGDEIRSIGGRADIREKGSFTYRDAGSGKLRKGVALDIWFQPASPDEVFGPPEPLPIAGY